MPVSNVLVVDDSPDNLTLLGELLQTEFRVTVATGGVRALELAARLPPPDLILLDVMMPGMDGFEVIRRLKESAATRDIPVVFVTALETTESQERGLDLGAVDYITKPFRPTLVVARVRAHLKLKQAHDQLVGENVQLASEVDRQQRENRNIRDVSIHALTRLVEVRDIETGNHLLRTQEYVRALGHGVRMLPRFEHALPPETVDLIARSAPLHDIGKVGIPDQILLKPGKLTPAEWEVMKTHARLGANAITRAEEDAEEPADFLRFAKEIALWHHERWDGSGYPDGLAGEAIPVSARLMAVADVFDALTSRRVYKAAMSFAQARALMTAERGRHFDPDILDTFLANYAEFCRVAECLADSAEALHAKAARQLQVAQ